ncbi:hypothetical protein QYE76_063514 [Lolium multiflorum]|uniref:Uncharacterized protein n=1 Tax=Lolium multiflorum TaxID=4521 RepID=A0AAD8W961_LOLMU|nr:hypothetical protein QYE76_063514 [Lolium multiflorum]
MKLLREGEIDAIATVIELDIIAITIIIISTIITAVITAGHRHRRSNLYLYWEKVQPLDEIALYARISSRPLMINWTEAAVALRDSYDQDNGRGKGILKIEDNITEEYRRQYGKKTDGNKNMGAEIKKPGTGRSNGKGNGRSTGKASSSRKPGPSWEIKMETTMKRMMQDFKREIMEELPERCAKDVVKLLNKSGVRYKPFAETLSDQYCYDEGCGSYLNGVPERKEFVYDKKSDTRSVSLPKVDVDKVSKEDNKEEDYITPARTKCDFLGDGTPDNPWQLPEDFKDASSSEVPSNIFEPALKKMNKQDEHKEGASEGSKSINSATGKNEDVNGKRKRKLPLKLQYPYIIENRTKRQPRKKPTPAIPTPSSNDVEIPQDSTALTAEHIAAAEIFVQLCCKSEVIDAYIGDLSRRVGDDRYLCAAWSSFLLEAHRKGHKTKNNNKNDDHLAEMINGSRNLINAQIVLATSNLLETVKMKVVRISKRFTK